MSSLETYEHREQYKQYKQLYLKQKGGVVTEPLNCLVITHNARLRCFVKKILGDAISNARFKNGVVLKVSFRTGQTTIEMINEGKIDEDNKKEGGYFVKTRVNPDDELFETQTLNHYLITTPINFYLIRHGEATHNIKSHFLIKALNFVVNKNKDTLLTNTGMRQAESTGRALNEYLLDNRLEIDFVFVSRLRRTRQTAVCILRQIESPMKTKELIVLPCCHELAFSKDGVCDGRYMINPPENKMDCDPENLLGDCGEIDGYNIIWDYYVKFYKDGNKCRDNDMLIMATQIALEKHHHEEIVMV